MNKPKNKKTPLQKVKRLVAIGCLCIGAALPAAAQSTLSAYQTGAPNFVTPAATAPLTLTNSQMMTFAANGTNSTEKTLRQDHGLSIFVTVISSNAVGGNAYLGFDLTPDSTVYTTKQPLFFLVPTAAPTPTGTLATNTYWTNWPASTLNNMRGIQLTVATNQLVGVAGATVGNTNSVQITLRYSQSGNSP